MSLTTHEKIRLESGFQARFARDAFLSNPDGSETTFFVGSDDRIKLVPEFGTGTTVAGISDVQVFVGLSGIQGSSQMVVSAVNVDLGSITVNTAPTSGTSLTVTYASSSISSVDVEEMRRRAENAVNSRLSLCYDLPLSPTPSQITSLATRLGSAHLLIRNYGTESQDTASDGYALYDQLMGSNQSTVGSKKEDLEILNVGEIGLICTPNYRLVDDDGNLIARNDAGQNKSGGAFVSGGRETGRVYDITEEPFRYKPWQADVNRKQSGTADNSRETVRG